MANNRRNTLLIVGGVVVVVVVLALVASASGWLTGLSLTGAAGTDKMSSTAAYALECDNIKQVFSFAAGLGSESELVIRSDMDERGSPMFAAMPGQLKFSALTLQRTANQDRSLVEWRQMVVEGDIDRARRNCSLKIVDPKGKMISAWQISNAWPSGYDYSATKGQDGNVGPILETVTLTYEGLNREQ